MCLCEFQTKYQGVGVSHHFGGVRTTKESRDMGYRSDSIAISRDMGPLSKAAERAVRGE